MKTRRARISDAGAIHRLVAYYAEQGSLLPRAEEEIRRNISHFLVLEENRHIVGCLSLQRDCCACPKQRSCKLVAVVATVIPERVMFPMLGEASPLPAC